MAPVGAAVSVLSGRCHPRESIPFNALDGVIDDLANHLACLPAPSLERVLPHHPWLLGALFPALATTPPLARFLSPRHFHDLGKLLLAFVISALRNTTALYRAEPLMTRAA